MGDLARGSRRNPEQSGAWPRWKTPRGGDGGVAGQASRRRPSRFQFNGTAVRRGASGMPGTAVVSGSFDPAIVTSRARGRLHRLGRGIAGRRARAADHRRQRDQDNCPARARTGSWRAVGSCGCGSSLAATTSSRCKLRDSWVGVAGGTVPRLVAVDFEESCPPAPDPLFLVAAAIAAAATLLQLRVSQRLAAAVRHQRPIMPRRGRLRLARCSRRARPVRARVARRR